MYLAQYYTLGQNHQCFARLHNCLFIINSKYLLNFLHERRLFFVFVVLFVCFFFYNMLLVEAATQRVHFSLSLKTNVRTNLCTESSLMLYFIVLNTKRNVFVFCLSLCSKNREK